MPEIAPKEKRAKSSLTAFQAFFGKSCCRQTKYNSTGPKTRSKCEGQARCGFEPNTPMAPFAEAGSYWKRTPLRRASLAAATSAGIRSLSQFQCSTNLCESCFRAASAPPERGAQRGGVVARRRLAGSGVAVERHGENLARRGKRGHHGGEPENGRYEEDGVSVGAQHAQHDARNRKQQSQPAECQAADDLLAPSLAQQRGGAPDGIHQAGLFH